MIGTAVAGGKLLLVRQMTVNKEVIMKIVAMNWGRGWG